MRNSGYSIIHLNKRFIYSISICAFLLSGCIIDQKPDSTLVILSNKTDRKIYMLLSNSDIIDTTQFSLRRSVINENSEKYFYAKIKFINQFARGSGKFARLFIIKKSDVDKYGWDWIIAKSIYSNKFLINEDTLVNHNWELIYTGKELR